MRTLILLLLLAPSLRADEIARSRPNNPRSPFQYYLGLEFRGLKPLMASRPSGTAQQMEEVLLGDLPAENAKPLTATPGAVLQQTLERQLPRSGEVFFENPKPRKPKPLALRTGEIELNTPLPLPIEPPAPSSDSVRKIEALNLELLKMLQEQDPYYEDRKRQAIDVRPVRSVSQICPALRKQALIAFLLRESEVAVRLADDFPKRREAAMGRFRSELGENLPEILPAEVTGKLGDQPYIELGERFQKYSRLYATLPAGGPATSVDGFKTLLGELPCDSSDSTFRRLARHLSSMEWTPENRAEILELILPSPELAAGETQHRILDRASTPQGHR